MDCNISIKIENNEIIVSKHVNGLQICGNDMIFEVCQFTDARSAIGIQLTTRFLPQARSAAKFGHYFPGNNLVFVL
jgi:hypothetical protein